MKVTGNEPQSQHNGQVVAVAPLVSLNTFIHTEREATVTDSKSEITCYYIVWMQSCLTLTVRSVCCMWQQCQNNSYVVKKKLNHNSDAVVDESVRKSQELRLSCPKNPTILTELVF